MGKGENAGDQHFLLFRQCFQKVTFPGSLKSGIEPRNDKQRVKVFESIAEKRK